MIFRFESLCWARQIIFSLVVFLDSIRFACEIIENNRDDRVTVIVLVVVLLANQSGP